MNTRNKLIPVVRLIDGPAVGICLNKLIPVRVLLDGPAVGFIACIPASFAREANVESGVSSKLNQIHFKFT